MKKLFINLGAISIAIGLAGCGEEGNSNDIQASFSNATSSMTQALNIKSIDEKKSGISRNHFRNASIVSPQSELIINEISTSKYTDDQRWIEVYNSGSTNIDLSQYSLRSKAVNNSYILQKDYTFPLPQATLNTGEYVLIQARRLHNAPAKTERSKQLIVLDNENYIPYWGSNGFVEIVQNSNNQTVDFVRFGTDTTLPTSAENWTGTSTIEALPKSLGGSLSRSQMHTDTNKAEDWRMVAFATPGGVNDVNHCVSDDDADNIPDCSERPETTYAGMDMYGWGARENQPDIFIELDYMDATNGNLQLADEGIIPHKEALDKVQLAFQNKGYSLHFDTGSLHGQDHNLGGVIKSPSLLTSV
ncbi:lamin tail domain-containing protein [Vibrio sp. S9_S30]|uniref:lamin tail domain-containing protein n=1 Tax=Vibrio sp. S9_S30 TaxID=2720226 RepID=UPI001680D6D7|nr:lamin tail domain-containing protein [Vibrio sp. S9_S30]MBD1557718.1 lamin tail domain-containing protein [Vibrio sp. S9_S30]